MAGLTRSAGYTDLSSTSSAQFIPEIWSGKMVEKFYDATVFGQIASTDYEGEIKDMGDNVVIRTTPSITINDYKIGQTLNYEEPTNPSVDLAINMGKYFAFRCDDVDRYQADIDLMDDWSGDASEQMKVAIDTDVLANIYVDVAAANKGLTAGAKSSSYNLGVTGTPVALAKANILDYLVDLGSVLDEQNVPETGRWLVLPTWACGMIKKSDLKDTSLTGDATTPIRNGLIGELDRFMVYRSNLVNSVTDGSDTVYNIIAGHKAGLTFAAQMTQMETLKNPNSFGNLVRGLNVYGYKVIEGKYMAELYAKKG
jgi:hypothetical protein